MDTEHHDTESSKLNVLLCGSNYAISYIRAILGHSRAFRLAGLLSRHSTRSRNLAQRLNLASVSDIAELSIPIDLGCVVVGGAKGECIALELLDRGKHVLIEHPVSLPFVERATALAIRKGIAFNVNTGFGQMPAVRHFVNDAKLQYNRPLFAIAVVNRRSLYSVVDILVDVLGHDVADNCSLSTLSNNADCSISFATREIRLQGVPITFLIDSRAIEKDDGSDMLITHRIIFGFPRGNLMLANSFGPVVWSPHFGNIQSREDRVHATCLDASFHTFREMRLQANRAALLMLARQIADGVPQPNQEANHLYAVASLHERVSSSLPPRFFPNEKTQ